MTLFSPKARADSMAQSAQTFSNISDALEAVRQNFHVSTGFENAIGDLDKTPVTLTLSGNNVAPVFDALTVQRPSYAWSLEDGFYDVYPKMKAQTFSQISVARYTAKDATLREAVEAIDKLPSAQRWLAHRHLRRADLIGGSRLMPPRGDSVQPDLQRRPSLDLKKVQVRTILNQVYRKFGETHWTIWHERQDITMFFAR